MSWALLAPALIVAGFALIAALERLHPYDHGQRFRRPGFWTDLLGYTLVQSYVLALLIGALIRWLDGATGLSLLGLLDGWPIWSQVALFVVTHDLYIYWFHRWQHRSAWLWRLHEAHHSSPELDQLAASRSHAVEILINQTIEFAPMVLLAAHPDVPLIKGALSAVWGLWIHANVDVKTGWLQWIVNGPEAHRWHHAVDADAHNRNFATKFALWDRLFGSAWLPRGRKPQGYGLSPFPEGYLRQQLWAFRRAAG